MLQEAVNTRRLESLATPDIKPPVKKGGPAWSFQVLVPVCAYDCDGPRRLATDREVGAVAAMLARHLGFTESQKSGSGCVEPGTPYVGETHRAFEVVTAPVPAAMRYIRALQAELERWLSQEKVWVVRSTVWIV